MNQCEIDRMLDLHRKWLNGDEGGERANLLGAYLQDANLQDANLRGTDLQYANLRGANLRGAYLRGADLRDAYLRGADLRDANLRGAYLRGANLRGAYLQDANLRDADLRGAYLLDAYLRGAYLRGANLRYADLRGADLQDANLRGTDLQYANLQDANLRGAYLPHFQICPELGEFEAWKKVEGGVVLRVMIPALAKRTSSLVGRKCRASHIIPLEAYEVGHDGELKQIAGVKKFGGWRYNDFQYTLNRKRKADKFDDDIRIECTHGIHFFMTAKEAIEW